MNLFLTMLPIYLLGNLHCIGMCGPLVMLLGKNRYRYFYFLGRTLSFSLAGLFAGEAGAIITLFLQEYHISFLMTFFVGTILCVIGCYTFFGWHYPGSHTVMKRLAGVSTTLSLLLLKEKRLSTFLFGFFTLALPCGQTLLVFSACALAGDALTGFANGLAFALLTSPALFFAMQAHALLRGIKPYYNKIIGCCAIIVGCLAISRGLADLNMLDHWILNPSSDSAYHIVIF